jgi:hypothetical protein
MILTLKRMERFKQSLKLRLLISVCIFVAISTQACADEVWVCHFKSDTQGLGIPVTRYWLHGDDFSEMEFPYRSYKVLYSNDVGIIAASGSAISSDFPGLPKGTKTEVWVDSFAIYKGDGDAIRGITAVLSGPRPPEHGKCHKQTEDEAGALWPRGFKQ